MHARTSPRVRAGKLAAFLLAAATACVSILHTPTGGTTSGPPGTPPPDAAGLKFRGADGCDNAQCHGAVEPEPDSTTSTNHAELTAWRAGDRHHVSFEALSGEGAESIVKQLNREVPPAARIATPAEHARCMKCHAPLAAAAALASEGVSCEACHGPMSRWDQPHRDSGWAQRQRRHFDGDPKRLFARWGLYDTKDPLARANRCAGCHLAVDAELLNAGHPDLAFELAFFSRSDDEGGPYRSRHWREPAEPYYAVRLWAAGQAVAVRESMRALADRAAVAAAPEADEFDGVTDAYRQAMAHYTVFATLLTTGAVAGSGGGDVDVLKAEADKLAKAVDARRPKAAGRAARAVAAAADRLARPAAALRPDRAKVLALLRAVAAASDAGRRYGDYAMLQQAYALHCLWDAYCAAERPADGEAVMGLIMDRLLAPDSPPTVEQFARHLAELSQALPELGKPK